MTVRSPEGPLAVRARGGVIFGSGGFAQNEERNRAHLAQPIIGTCSAPGNTGDLLEIAEALRLAAAHDGLPVADADAFGVGA